MPTEYLERCKGWLEDIKKRLENGDSCASVILDIDARLFQLNCMIRNTRREEINHAR